MARRAGTVLDRLRALGGGHGGWSEEKYAEALLRARARRQAAPRGVEAETTAGVGALGARIAGERYALPLEALSGVMALVRWTPVPGQPPYLLGVTNLRGEIRPVLDLYPLLGQAPPPPGAPGWVVLLKAGGGEVGLRVDALDRVVSFDPATLTHPHESGNGLPQRFISGIAPDALILLDTEQLLALDALKDARAGGYDES